MNSEMMISGKWFNKNTGNVVNVINNVIDGDDMIIVTDKGPINMKDFGEYIQMSEEVYDDNGQIIGNEEINYNEMIIPPKQEVHINKNTQPSKNETIVNGNHPIENKKIEHSEISTKENNNNHIIIGKFFDKIKNKDELVQISINTNILPINDLQTIINYMDVPIEEISNYITNTIINRTYINSIVSSSLEKILKAD